MYNRLAKVNEQKMSIQQYDIKNNPFANPRPLVDQDHRLNNPFTRSNSAAINIF